MRILDILGMGFRNMLRRKTRTFLTVVGVLIGATAIVIMLSLGIGMEVQMNRSMDQMGDLTIINLRARDWVPNDAGMWQEQTINRLDSDLLARIRTWDEVEAVTPYLSLSQVNVFAGRNNVIENAWVIGIDASFIPYLRMNVARGEFPQPGDTDFIIFGRNTPYWFIDRRRPPRDPWAFRWDIDFDEEPRINVFREDIALQGLVWGNWNPETGQMEQPPGARFRRHSLPNVSILDFIDWRGWGWDEHGQSIYVHYSVLVEIQREIERADRIRPSQSRLGVYDEIRIKVVDIPTTDIVMDRLRHEEGLQLEDSWLAEARESMQQQLFAVQALLGGIGAISLFVAAIGITNTMFMSTYERTKEIGVMKVLGCSLGGIKSMFLFEASIIGFCGGIFGSALSLGLSMLVNRLDFVQSALGGGGGMGMGGEQMDISVIPIWLVLAAIIFSTFVGLFSGYLPARRATKISALEAIRNE